MPNVPKMGNYSEACAKFHELPNIKKAEKTVAEIAGKTYVPETAIGQEGIKVASEVYPGAEALQARFAPYAKGKATGEDVVQNLTNPRQNA